MPQNTPMKRQFTTIDGRTVMSNLPQHWGGNDWKITGVDNPLPVGNYVQTESGVWIPQKGSDDGAADVRLTGSNVEYLVFDIDRDKNNKYALNYGKSGYGFHDTFGAFKSFFIYAENNTDREQEVVMRIYYKGSEDVRVDIPIGVVAVGAVLTKEIHAPFKDFIFRIIGNSANSGTFSTVILGGH